MPEFRREIPEYVPAYRKIPRDAPSGTFYCEPCDMLHYPGETCWYWEGEQRAHEIDAAYPEWSGVMETYNPVFYHEDGEER